MVTLIILGGLQIILRNVFHSGLLWADPLMRHIVLWLGCLGAALATTSARHINIDVFSRALPAIMAFLIFTAFVQKIALYSFRLISN